MKQIQRGHLTLIASGGEILESGLVDAWSVIDIGKSDLLEILSRGGGSSFGEDMKVDLALAELIISVAILAEVGGVESAQGCVDMAVGSLLRVSRIDVRVLSKEILESVLEDLNAILQQSIPEFEAVALEWLQDALRSGVSAEGLEILGR